VAAATRNAPDFGIPEIPFPESLRDVVEPHVRKARRRRAEVLQAIREATGAERYDATMSEFQRPGGLADEGEFAYDAEAHPLAAALRRCAEAGDKAASKDLSRLHESGPGAKHRLFRRLTLNPEGFRQAYDAFVLEVCAPRFAKRHGRAPTEIWFQAFPCVRVVQPGDFSIGPHADAAYGHHPCSVNFYVPLTRIGGTSSLFLESSPGREDWHPIEWDGAATDVGFVKHFAGAVCAHWTTENKTARTRVSLDFRLIAGPDYSALACGGKVAGGQRDAFRERPGYYSRCDLGEDGRWTIVERGAPDPRTGFPWTVRNWETLLRKEAKKRK
jgi:hypothetical protein